MMHAIHYPGLRCPTGEAQARAREAEERRGIAAVAEEFGVQMEPLDFQRPRRPRTFDEMMADDDRWYTEAEARSMFDHRTREYEINRLYRSHLQTPLVETRLNVFEVTCAWCLRTIVERLTGNPVPRGGQ